MGRPKLLWASPKKWTSQKINVSILTFGRSQTNFGCPNKLGGPKNVLDVKKKLCTSIDEGRPRWEMVHALQFDEELAHKQRILVDT